LNLKNFITQTLLDVVGGVAAVQETYGQGKGAISPAQRPHNPSQNIDFDLAVVADGSGEKERGIAVARTETEIVRRGQRSEVSRVLHKETIMQCIPSRIRSARVGAFFILCLVGVEVSGQQSSTPHGIEAYISEDALQALYVRQTNLGDFGDVTLRAGVFFNERRDLVTVADLLSDVVDAERFPRWTFSIGSRVYGALLNQENQDIFSVGFGGTARYSFGAREVFSFQVSGFYAPDILTFGEGDNVTDASARLEIKIRDRLTGFVGYRSLEFDLTQFSDREVDDGVHIGFRRTF